MSKLQYRQLTELPVRICKENVYHYLCSILQNTQRILPAPPVQMVDITKKHCEYLTQLHRHSEAVPFSYIRWARASGKVHLSQELLDELGVQREVGHESPRMKNNPNNSLITPKGDVFLVAQVAAIQATKNTSSILPLCHQVSEQFS